MQNHMILDKSAIRGIFWPPEMRLKYQQYTKSDSFFSENPMI